MEVTKWLKPSISVSRIGDSASVQAATRVNAEQALYGAFEVKHIFYTTLHFLHSSFFVRLGIPFFAPTHTRVAADAHRGLSRSAVALPWPHAPSFPGRALTGPSTAATLVVVGTMIRGELCHRARSSRHNLVFGRSVVT